MAADGSLAAFYDRYDFPEEVRVEFIDGEIIMQANPMMLHDVPGRTFVRTVPEPFEAWSERGVHVGDEDRPRPDVVIIRAGDWADDMRDLPVSVVLAVVEVVSTGRAAIRRDYEDKFTKYQDCGIPVYVIIDPNNGEWLLFTRGADGAYQEADRAPFGTPIPFPDPLGFSVDTSAFHRYPVA
ncbi:Uma2 family endonuclease [Peterkaempfera griseoplana]|uniref:Uma2 family endonuclease n=1 Tax=Peterkaempfera griseoplana TaxID=66896 RepID=UPI0006E2A7CD|nr:Uma2 family endonuclease [Peterkaempfera griseoplana]